VRTSFVLFLLCALLFSSLPSASPDEKKSANFDIRLVKAYRADKDAMPDELEDISKALKNATTYNAFKLVKSFSLSVKTGKKGTLPLEVENLKLELSISKYDSKSKVIKGTLSVIKMRTKKVSVLCRAKIDMKKGGVLCIVTGSYEGGELIVAVKLDSVE